MLNKATFLIVFFWVIFSNYSAYAYSYLTVRDPRGWESMQGTIEEATVSVKPKGVYMEIGLYLTFSARDWYFNISDSLEVDFYFDLPENSIVHDSWLWVGEDIIRGEIMDKWTASAIYEDIVKRRQDPSILFKRYGNQYELRIFPMLASETRKVKITYLVPVQWNSNNILASLPTELLRTSKNPVSPLYLLTWLNTEWKNPKILEFPDIQFQSLSDSSFGKYLRADIPSEAVQSSVHFSLDSPLKNGVYINSFKNGNEGIYQLVFLPSKAMSFSTSSKVTILFDYDASRSDISTKSVLNTVKSYLQSNLSEKDSINLIFSQLSIKRASETWLSADSITIENIFDNLGENPISNYSNLPSLLANGIDFVKRNGNDGSIVLISNSDQVGDYKVTNQLIDDLVALMDPKIPIHVSDFQDRNYSYNYIGGRYYYGNEYFYTNMSRLTSANYFSVRSGYSFPELIATTISSVGGFMSSFDLHTNLDKGYCYGRFDLSNQKNSVYLDKPIVQVGKYNGEFPFVIEASGVYESEVFLNKLIVGKENISQADSLAVKAWTGNYIQNLESKEQTNNVISEIIDYSVRERVLSIYSAFLCLEPSRGGEVCYDCMDESKLVSVEDNNSVESDTLLVGAYPNPFNNAVKISISLPVSEVNEDVTFKIYNILGQVVRNFEVDLNQKGNQYNFTWFGKNDSGSDVSSGTYFFVAENSKNRHAIKLLFLK